MKVKSHEFLNLTLWDLKVVENSLILNISKIGLGLVNKYISFIQLMVHRSRTVHINNILMSSWTIAL